MDFSSSFCAICPTSPSPVSGLQTRDARPHLRAHAFPNKSFLGENLQTSKRLILIVEAVSLSPRSNPDVFPVLHRCPRFRHRPLPGTSSTCPTIDPSVGCGCCGISVRGAFMRGWARRHVFDAPRVRCCGCDGTADQLPRRGHVFPTTIHRTIHRGSCGIEGKAGT